MAILIREGAAIKMERTNFSKKIAPLAPKMPQGKKARKKFWIIFALASFLVLTAAVVLFLCIFTAGKDPKKMVLSSSDVPSNYSLYTQGYKDEGYWGNQTLLKNAENVGFSGGYYRTFSYESPSSIYYIISSVSIYKKDMQDSFDAFKSTLSERGCEPMEIKPIGEDSFGCVLNENTNQTSLNDSSATAIINRKHYDIAFYKKDVLSFVSVVQVSVGRDSGTDDLSEDAVGYAADMLKKI